MPINLESLNAMQDNMRVFLNNDGTFQKASFFSRKETVDQNKQNIVDTLKQTIASDPKYFGVQKHLEGMIDGLMTSKLSAKGITAGQIRDILAYADSLSTPKERQNSFMSHAIGTALSLHAAQEGNSQSELPKELADSSKQIKDSYSNALHDMLKGIFKATANLREVNLENVVRQFDEKAVLIKSTLDALDMPGDLADTFFAKSIEKNYTREQLETLGAYFKEINNNPQLNATHRSLLFDIVTTDNGPLERDKFDTAVLAKENNFVYGKVKDSAEFNAHIESSLSVMGFGKSDMAAVKEQIAKSVSDDVYKLVFSGTKATPDMINEIADNKLAAYNSSVQEVKAYAGENALLEKIGMRTIADLAEIPKNGYLTALHTASEAINPAFIKEICNSASLDRFDTATGNLAKAVYDSSSHMDQAVMPNEPGMMKPNLTVHILGECLNTLSAAERQNLFDRLSSDEVTNLFSMYANDVKNADSIYIAQTLSFIRDQIAYMDNRERTAFPHQECDYGKLTCSLRNRNSLDSILSGNLPRNLLNDINPAQYQDRFNRITQAMFQVNFLAEMQKMAGINMATTIFQRDISRDLTVTLPDGTRLENNFETAKNQLASYVSHGRVNTFAELNSAENRTAQILMACLSQETEKIVNMGASMAFNGEKNEPAFITMENREANRGLPGGGRAFSVIEDGSGGFEIQYQCTRSINFFQENRAKAVPVMLGANSREHYELNVHITGDEIRRLQTVDFGRMGDISQNPAADDFLDWHAHFDLGEYNMQNVSITGGFNIYGVQEQQ